jgi:hypothetical protein
MSHNLSKPSSEAQAPIKPLKDKVIDWQVPDEYPEEFELSREEYEDLKKDLVLALEREPRFSQETLVEHGYKCWLEYVMHQYAYCP